MLGPKTTSSLAQFKKSAMAARAFGDHLVGAAAGDERSAGIRVRSREIVRDGVDHRLRHLRTARRVEEYRWLSVYGLTQSRELLPYPIDVQLAELDAAIFAPDDMTMNS